MRIHSGPLYRWIMRFAHKHNWHYAPPVYPDGDTQLWCQWCGFRQTIKRRDGPLPGTAADLFEAAVQCRTMSTSFGNVATRGPN